MSLHCLSLSVSLPLSCLTDWHSFIDTDYHSQCTDNLLSLHIQHCTGCVYLIERKQYMLFLPATPVTENFQMQHFKIRNVCCRYSCILNNNHTGSSVITTSLCHYLWGVICCRMCHHGVVMMSPCLCLQSVYPALGQRQSERREEKQSAQSELTTSVAAHLYVKTTTTFT